MALKLLVLTDEIYPDAYGGIGKSLYNEATALVRRGHAVTVLVRGVDPTLPPIETIAGIEIRRIPGPARTSRLYYLYPLVMVFNVIRQLRALRGSFDLVLVYNSIFLVAARLSGFTAHVPSVVVFYSSIGQEIQLNASRRKYGALTPLARLAAAMLGVVERWEFRRARTILTRSHFSYDTLRKWSPGAPISERVIPIGLDTTQYQPSDQAQARARLGLPDDRPILITTRRLVARMGLENLIRAMALLRDQGIAALLLIAGRGYLQPALEALTAELDLEAHVRLLGFVPEEQLPVYLAAADLFVLPTEALEGFGLATIEALAVGLPVVGTPVGATPEILEPIDPALVAQSAAPDALAACIARWLADDAGRTALRRRCRDAVETHYRDDLVAEQLEQLFARCLSSRQGKPS
ncbi:MAG: glycosyltransferase family 4 protein [Anaerolineae bacterium]|nr:glycosyltransferase family 4 protein [Anaerolineae bacterium]